MPVDAAPLLNPLSHSSQALPAPNPRPTQAGHALRLKSRTENTTPNDSPKDERIRKDERHWSHLSLSNASLTGLLDRPTGNDGGVELDDILDPKRSQKPADVE